MKHNFLFVKSVFLFFIFFMTVSITAQVVPVDDASGVSVTSDFTWTIPTPNGTDYYIQVFSQGPTVLQLQKRLPDGATSYTFNPADLTTGSEFDYNKTYSWRIRYWKDASNTGILEGPYSFSTELDTPIGIDPSGVYTDPTTFNWTMADNYSNVDFQVDVYLDAGYKILLGTNTVNNALTADITLPSAGTYYWKITATVNDGGAANNGESTNIQAGVFILTLPAPILTAPVNGLTGVSVEPLMTWDAVIGAVSYKLYVDDADDFLTPLYEIDEGTSLSKQFEEIIANFPLDNNTMYYWKVAAIDNMGNEFPSSTNHFTTIPSVPVTMSLPNDASIVNMTDVTFYWYIIGSQGSMKFKIQIFEDDGTAPDATDWLAPTFEATTLNSNQLFSLLQGKKYYWRVIVLTAGDEVINYSATQSFTTGGGTIVTPIQSWPLDGTIVYTTSPTLSWYLSDYGSGLEFQVKYSTSVTIGGLADTLELDSGDKYPADSNMVADGSTDLDLTLPALTPGTSYYWQVRVYDPIADEYGSWSAVASFATQVSGTVVTPIQSWPLDGTTVYTTSPTLYWYLSGTGSGLEFQVKYSTSVTIGGLADTLELDSGDKYPADGDMVADGSTNLNLTLSALTPGTPYYWQVRVYDPITDEYGSWSAVASFLTQGSGTLVKPIASYPTGGVTVYTTAPTLYWYTSTAGTGLSYNIDIELVSDGGVDGVAEYNNVNALNKLLTLVLIPGETYEWQVQSDNNGALAGGKSQWSDPQTFSVIGGVGNGYPVITWPVGNPTVYTTKPTINWFIEGSSLGLTDVVLVYNEGSTTNNGTVGTTISIPLPATSYTFTTDLNEGSKYYFAIASTDGSTYSAWDENSFTVYSTVNIISDPVLTSPIGGINLASKSPTLYWFVSGDHTAIQNYEVTYSTSDVFASGATTVETPTNSNLPLTNLSAGATYFWKVRSHYTDGSYSNFSVIETFTIIPGANNALQPIIGGPNNVILNTLEPTLSWVFSAEHSETLKSEILLADNPDMINAITIENIENTNYNISDLEGGKSYFWRVRSYTTDNVYSAYSGQGVFKVGDNNVTHVVEHEIIPEKFEVSQNYPNPFNPSTMIEYALPEAQFVTLRIYNMLGQEVATLVNNEVEAGVHNIIWNGVNNSGVKVATGTYIYRVVAGNNIMTKKMILLK